MQIIKPIDNCFAYQGINMIVSNGEDIHRHTVLAHLKNGSCEIGTTDDPTIVIPQAFHDCRALWDRRGKVRSWPQDQWAFVTASIEPLLYATIDPEDAHYDNGLLNPRGTIQAPSVQLSSLSFETGPIPIISATAQFELLLDRGLTDTEQLYDWQEQTDWLDWCVNFGWRFPNGDGFDAAETHDGIQFELRAV